MDVDISPLLRSCLDVATEKLAADFRGVFARETVARYLQESAELIGERPTVGPNFLPVCERNAGRSQIAAALSGDACPVYPGRRYQDWPVCDPAGRPLAAVRRIRYEIYHHVWDLLEKLMPSGDLLALHRLIGGPQ